MSEEFSAESVLVHAGRRRIPGEPVTPPLVPASIYYSAGEPAPGRGYGREGNPSWEALEAALGEIEQASALIFASGQAASLALMLALAATQMPRGFGPLLSFELASAKGADAVVSAAALIVPAASFGGVESTWERRARWAAETASPGLIRLSVGVESAGDLMTDIDQALEVL